MMARSLSALLLVVAVQCMSVQGFTPALGGVRPASQLFSSSYDGSHSHNGMGSYDSGNDGGFRMHRLEFTIHEDGRVEERVYGVKGAECHKVTDKINALLGKVVSTQPTEELYEVEVKNQNFLYVSEEDSTTWEGKSSW